MEHKRKWLSQQDLEVGWQGKCRHPKYKYMLQHITLNFEKWIRICAGYHEKSALNFEKWIRICAGYQEKSA